MNKHGQARVRAGAFIATALLALLATPVAAQLPTVTQLVTYTANLADDPDGGNGSAPNFTLVEMPDGMLYGQTSTGAGTSDLNNPGGMGGSFARFDPGTGSYEVLERENPGTLTVTADGTLYGTTGGLRRYQPGAGWTLLTPLSRAADGVNPPALWTEGPDGRLYGTDADNIFAIERDGSGLELLHAGSVALGRAPGRLIAHSNGRLYGTTTSGGEAQGGNGPRGVLFSMLPDGSGYTKLHEFNGSDGNLAGAAARGVLVEGPDGRIYGIARHADNTENSNVEVSNGGTLFRVGADGEGFEILYRFPRPEGNTAGSKPLSLILADDGHFYGVANAGGINNKGLIFRWHATEGYQALHAFGGVTGEGRNRIMPNDRPASGNEGSNEDGMIPVSLIQAGDGRFYGVTQRGGDWGWGMVFGFEPGNEVPVYKFPPSLQMYIGRVSTNGNRVAEGQAFLLGWRGEAVGDCRASTDDPGNNTWDGARPFTHGQISVNRVYEGEAVVPAALGVWEYALTCETAEDGPIRAAVTVSVEPAELPLQHVGDSAGALAPALLACLLLLVGLRVRYRWK